MTTTAPRDPREPPRSRVSLMVQNLLPLVQRLEAREATRRADVATVSEQMRLVNRGLARLQHELTAAETERATLLARIHDLEVALASSRAEEVD
jgi:hypothetical protein